MINFDYLPSVKINKELQREYIHKCSPKEKYIEWWKSLPDDICEEAVDKELRNMDEVALYLLSDIDYQYEILDKQVIYRPFLNVSDCMSRSPTIGFKIRILRLE